MAGDISNPRIWVNADVFVGDLGTPMPTNVSSSLNSGFKAIGLISQDDGLVESRDEDTKDHYAYGNILVRTTRSKHKRTITVTALEDNAVVFGLVNPGSTVSSDDGLSTRIVKVPAPNPKAFVIETRDGDVIRRRCITRGEVIDVGDIEMKDSEMSMVELTIVIYPDDDGVLWQDISNDLQYIASA